ncbi:hypothetical protein E2F50_22235 [Rhizobium deserti]|uniref:Uncharacterized protein n=1 Tax=Rhizobium deserti TaxID=2547961 RepID=A0A4R5U6M9_9HYPH|nr:hypothetical protein [Rhizobium deserti]TDK29912.1 hypothetical protein E2F50_22235 [Rhizobium deserti]
MVEGEVEQREADLGSVFDRSNMRPHAASCSSLLPPYNISGYRVAIFSPGGHFGVVTPPGSNRVLDLGEMQPRSTVVKRPLVCLERAKAVVLRLMEP